MIKDFIDSNSATPLLQEWMKGRWPRGMSDLREVQWKAARTQKGRLLGLLGRFQMPLDKAPRIVKPYKELAAVRFRDADNLVERKRQQALRKLKGARVPQADKDSAFETLKEVNKELREMDGDDDSTPDWDPCDYKIPLPDDYHNEEDVFFRNTFKEYKKKVKRLMARTPTEDKCTIGVRLYNKLIEKPFTEKALRENAMVKEDDLEREWKDEWGKENFGADRLLRKIMHCIDDGGITLPKPYASQEEHGIGDNAWSIPTQYANLLANFILTENCSKEMHESWFTGSSDQSMAMLEPKTYEDSGDDDDGKNDLDLEPPGFEKFPNRLGPLYLENVVDWVSQKIQWHRDRRLLTIGDTSEKYETTDRFPAKFEVSADRRCEFFVYIYPSEECKECTMSMGGFAFVSTRDDVREVLKISLEPSEFAISFAAPRSVRSLVCDENGEHGLDEERVSNSDAKDIRRLSTAKEFQNFEKRLQGFESFRFIHDNDESVHLSFGAFAFYHKGGKGNGIVFPIRPSDDFKRKVKHRCSKDRLDMRGKTCVYKATITTKGCTSYKAIKEALFGDGDTASEGSGRVEVASRRLKQPGLAHPVVLWSLSKTPSSNTKLFDCASVQAIVIAAFAEAYNALLLDSLVQIVLSAVIVYFTSNFRRQNLGRVSEWEPMHFVFFALLVVLLVKEILQQIFEMIGLRLCFHRVTIGWREWIQIPRVAMKLLHCVFVALLVGMLLGGLDDNFPELGRQVLAASGSLCWLQQFYLLQSFRGFGERYLPISYALNDSASFLLVSCCILMMCLQMAYALTRLPPGTLVNGIYQMGMLGNMQEDIFVIPEFSVAELTNGTAPVGHERMASALFSYSIYMLVGLFVCVSMSNIFISVLISAYSKHNNQVEKLLAQARARAALFFILGWFGFTYACKRVDSHEGVVCKMVGLEDFHKRIRSGRIWYLHGTGAVKADGPEEQK